MEVKSLSTVLKKNLQNGFQSEENVVNCNLHLFTSFVRPQSWLSFEKIKISIPDECAAMYLFSKLEQPTNVNAIKSYISNYGSYDFKTNFNVLLKEKVERHHALDQRCTWECLELFFDNVASSDANDINYISQGLDIDMGVVSEIDLSLSNTSYEDFESDWNIHDDSSYHSEGNDNESDWNIDDDSSYHSEGSDNETNHNPSSNNNGNNGVLIMME
ncbi:unnamed protein product [Mytilus edulis]|uniref:Uncharacterized protein n=1 Tax=Mytilus edulis TaxID=6550 RepID=A0A8S3UWZ0_MYTED|nr:unnamed protein product [Mytilus edulis]